MHAPFTPVYKDSLIATISYTVGACDDIGSFTVATDISYYKTWIEEQREPFASVFSTRPCLSGDQIV